MKTTYLYAKFILIMTMIALTFACSSKEDSSIIPDPQPPTGPETDTPLIIKNGVVTGVAEGTTDIIFPKGVKRIQKDAFKNNISIRKLTLNEGLEVIEEDAFIFSSLTEINFPSTLKEVGKYAFYECKNLSKADMSLTSITILPDGTFGSSGIQSVTFPTSLQEIGAQAFINTSNLTAVEIPVNVKSLGNEAFRKCGATSVLLPNNLSFMDQRTFYLCPNLQEVKTYGQITVNNPNGAMKESCFQGCPEIIIFEIPQNMRSIAQGQLAGNNKIESIIIPANINYIAFSAFNNTGIKTVTVLPATPPAVGLAAGVAWYGFPDNVTSIMVPTGTVDSYKAASGWKEFANKIQ